MVARKAGFGTVEPPAVPEKIPRYYVWREDLFSPPVEAILSIPEMQKTVPKKESCINQSSGLPYRAEFFVFDSNIKSSLCVSEFRWLGPRDGGPYAPAEFFAPRENTEEYLRTVVAINGNSVGSNLIIDLWPEITDEKHPHLKISSRLHKFEAIGLKAGGLVIDFAEANQNHVTTAVDGLQFDRLYNGQASCEYGASEAAPPIYDDRTLFIISDFIKNTGTPEGRRCVEVAGVEHDWIDAPVYSVCNCILRTLEFIARRSPSHVQIVISVSARLVGCPWLFCGTFAKMPPSAVKTEWASHRKM